MAIPRHSPASTVHLLQLVRLWFKSIAYPSAFFAKQDDVFCILQDFTLKVGILFHFATSDKNILKIKNTQARDMTVVQRYFNVESTYNTVDILFVLAITLLKTHLNRYVSA